MIFIGGCETSPLEINRFLYGQYAIVPYEKTLHIIDLSRPTNPQIVSSLEIGSPIANVVLFDTYAAVLRREEINYASINDSSPGGIVFVDLTRPENPQIISELAEPVHPNTFYKVGQTGYVSGYDGEFEINLVSVANPHATKKIEPTPGSITWVYVQQDDDVLAMGGGCNFRTGYCQGKIKTYEVGNGRLTGSQTESINIPIYDAVVMNDTLYTIGRGVAAAPFNRPIELEKHHLPENIAFHQGKIIGDGRYLYAVGDHRLVILDTADPLNPTPVGIEESAPRGTFFRDLVYQEPYVTLISQYGLHVIDMTHPDQPRGAAFLPLGDN